MMPTAHPATPAVTISPRVQAWWASKGICSMKRSS